jgi:hypothetical protein
MQQSVACSQLSLWAAPAASNPKLLLLLLPLLQISKSQADTGANHAVSALKFGIIKKFLMLGWAVLLSDIDVCVLQDPFKHLYR